MRYSRQEKFFEKNCDLKLTNISKLQDSFKDKKIIIVGCGGVGSIISELLVRGGFLNLILIDNDIIDETNLQRQTFFEKDIGKSKSKTLKKNLIQINSKSKIKVIESILDELNIKKICKNSDLIVDATDNFETRVIINNFCEKNNLNWLYTGAVKGEVICCLFRGEEKLFSKIFPNKYNIINENCCEIGVLASTTHSAAATGYNEILKYFLNEKLIIRKDKNNTNETKLIKFNLWNYKIFEIKVK